MKNKPKDPEVIECIEHEVPTNVFALEFPYTEDKHVFEDYWDAEGLEAFKAWVAKREQEGC